MLGIAALSMGATAGVMLVSQGEEAIAAEPALVEHQIRDGETLWDLSQSYNVPTEVIAATNDLDKEAILAIGQTIAIPTTALESEAIVATPEPVQVAVVIPTEESNPVLPTVEASAPEIEEIEAAVNLAPTPVEQPEVTSPQTSTLIHKVQPGETPGQLAERYQISVETLLASNDIRDPRTLQINQELIIPAEAVTPALTPEVATQSVNTVPAATPTQEIAQSTPILAAPVASSSGDGRIDRLKEEIMQMREEYRAQQARTRQAVERPTVQAPAVTDANPIQGQQASPEWQRQQELRKPGTANVQGAEPGMIASAADVVAAAPIPSQGYNRLLQLPAGQSVEPQIPPLQERDQYLPDRPQEFNGFIWPARGTLTSGYGPRWGRMHRGIDIAAPTGTPIYAAASGEVISAGWNNGGYGNWVRIRHADGSITLYAHHSRVLVRTGDRVEQGQQIALMGSTGFSTGPHLHFEVHPAGSGATNPMAFLPSR
ncbi:peptidoglycan DD-metalloendopeptidase family protein [Spirulina sp. CCNP1310]|uniref:peptidoglycan DD-metalloendopeptidase family protein n=1 Tax=Spirulina sp. CCNP1310 TaxID=3110249 RepID=UPI002B1FC019|nr:peptidoglycan DD-metalloendopeptidase family protein [Spirulina sp. CCNP1310]MEA5418601.1 peptidoglycan DD-metalloendopeptidase family protein [Spirulina sp. CCNP1310]